ncbi:signal peptide containing protein [Theileria equi strain WA]|uniref:Signal peptide containing protein n=1 Tax=Theileria equi strain WA TaxID=1537102 RepID=L1LEW9_THEEQ|nr:signal peptide containing protein [Theileria equi strain WA]EKX73819.1 signal peptide containing protein [Theileria equi strain WA]|eukprot:XP_004833271.1 signal peptide containing protein [Theileria equi strain WA]
MNVFSILLVTCLLGLCHCSRSKFPAAEPFVEVLDDYPEMETRRSGSSGKRLVWDMAHGIVYEEYTQSLARRHDYENVEYISAEASKMNTHSGNTTIPVTLDLSKPDEELCRAIKTDIDGIPAVVYLPKSNQINKIVNGKKDVWIASKIKAGRRTVFKVHEEKCFYCVAFLKGNKPCMVAIGAELLQSKFLQYSTYKDNKWSRSATVDEKEIDALKVKTNTLTKFTLDLSSLKEYDEKYQLVKCGKDGVNRLVTPQPGNLIERIVDGNLEVWTASDNQVCYLCEYYPKDDSGEIKLHVRKNEDSFSFTLFDKVDGSWKKR